jgi:hypothetical protein
MAVYKVCDWICSSSDITLNISISCDASQCSLLEVYTNFGEDAGPILRQVNNNQNVKWWTIGLRSVMSLWCCSFLQINRTWCNSYSVGFLGLGYDDSFLCLENKENVNCIYPVHLKNKLNLNPASLSPRANYTNRATAACRRSNC